MKQVVRIGGTALVKAVLNGIVALSLMLLVEFSISGNLKAYPLYVYASLLITATFFVYQLLRARRLCQERPPQAGHQR